MNYLLEPVIGICRFSFCGNGDWAAYADVEASTDIDLLRLEQAERLYEDGRMALRFYLFENFLLPSLLAQKDPNFVLIVLTSDIMPSKHLKRLHKICGVDDRIIPVVSDAATVHDALMPELARLNAGLSRPLVQFRIDDDDCLSHDYVRELRSYMMRLGDVMPLAYSRSSGVMVTSYARDGATHIYRAKLPFNSMGTAIRVQKEHTIFSFGHSRLLRRFPAMVDNNGMGFLAIKIDGHDSRPIDMQEHVFKRAYTRLSDTDAETILSKWFGFIGEDGSDRHETLVSRVETAAGLRGTSPKSGPRLKAV